MNSVSPQRVYNLIEELRHNYKREVKNKGFWHTGRAREVPAREKSL